MHSALLLCFLIITQINEPACVDESAMPDPISHRAQRERQTMPYMPGIGRTAPSRHVQFGSHVSIQVNVDANGNNILDDAANEPSIAVDPTNPNRMAIGWRQFDTIEYDFRQAGYAYTSNAGRSWTFPGVITPGVGRSDPVLAADNNGQFYFCSLRINGFYSQLFVSEDHGQTWQFRSDMSFGDKPWIHVDQTGGPGTGMLYFDTAQGGGRCSPDGGNSWFGLGAPFKWGTITTGPGGELYEASNLNDNFQVTKVFPAWITQYPPTFTTTTINLGGRQSSFGGPNPGGLLGQIWIATDISSGPRRGYVYVVNSILPPGVGTTQLHFSRSTNTGASWSAPIRINDDIDPSQHFHWFATMSVAPNGRIDVI